MSSAPLAQQAPVTPAFKMIRTLAAIAMISGLVVVLVYQGTKPIIEENQRIAIESAVFEVIPGATRREDFLLSEQGLFRSSQEGASGEPVYVAYGADGELLGVALQAAAQGYQDVIRLLYGYDPKCACVRGIKILKMTETPGLGDKIASDPEFLANFEALDARVGPAGEGLANPVRTVKHGTKEQPWEIDAISGATVSSVAVGKALDASLQRMAPLIQRHLPELAGAGK